MKIIKSVPNVVGNGVDDDYNAIQCAIVSVAAAGGGTVVLPGGRYSISQGPWWTAPNVYLVGDGAAILVPRPTFIGAAGILMGKASLVKTPTFRGGIENITVDLSQNSNPNLVGVKLVQTWQAHIRLLRISNPNGLAVPIQKGFVLDAGTLPTGLPGSTWSANNDIYSLQISGSFANAVQHVALNGGMVNATNYFGGFAYGAGSGKPGTFAVRIEAGDSTRFYGMAVEDWDTAAFVGSPNNGPFDLRIEGCNTKYAVAPGITFSIPSLTNAPASVSAQ